MFLTSVSNEDHVKLVMGGRKKKQTKCLPFTAPEQLDLFKWFLSVKDWGLFQWLNWVSGFFMCWFFRAESCDGTGPIHMLWWSPVNNVVNHIRERECERVSVFHFSKLYSFPLCSITLFVSFSPYIIIN